MIFFFLWSAIKYIFLLPLLMAYPAFVLIPADGSGSAWAQYTGGNLKIIVLLL